ncbi:hypothetical protein HNE_2159 [Hyphomonas neptunium ATCC 15444]|uniref:Uncharacterized protein n=2 Tax=Hyphomonas TaxID=85 RepID=Q0C087_HYPNA|nr:MULTISPECIES: hypothetical protein [Hyphomonas]ABI77979.1 hypothetical protein HNE_2159 [Hyphomonas neptunium ATCC 15444]KCZ90563.1 hypothetical protein HHI_13530 [Hyphomonas hirschiana VP5]
MMELAALLLNDFRTYVFVFVVLVVALELYRRHRKNQAPRIPAKDYWRQDKEK